MQRRYRLRRSSEFEHARTEGKAWSHPLLTVYVHAREDLDPSRVGIVVTKRTGKATVRNRVKRRLREAARTLYPMLAAGHDIVAVARPAAAEASTPVLFGVLQGLLTRALALMPTATSGVSG